MAGLFEQMLASRRRKVAEVGDLEIFYMPVEEVRFRSVQPFNLNAYHMNNLLGHPDMGIDSVPVSAVQVGDMVLATLGGGSEDVLHEVLCEVEEGHGHIDDVSPWIARPRFHRW